MYDHTTWQRMTSEYTQSLGQLELPPDPTPATLMQLQAGLDRLHTKARLEHCQLKAELSQLKESYKALSKVYYLDVKDQAKTEKERDALVYKKLMEQTYQGYDLVQAIGLLEGQVLFLDTVISLLSSKAQRLVTMLGSLKLEQSLIQIEAAGEMAQLRARTN